MELNWLWKMLKRSTNRVTQSIVKDGLRKLRGGASPIESRIESYLREGESGSQFAGYRLLINQPSDRMDVLLGSGAKVQPMFHRRMVSFAEELQQAGIV